MRRHPYRHYRRAMRRRFRSRLGGYPILIPPPYEPVAAMMFAGFARVLYRHRSAFMPFAVTGAAFILAAIVHRHHPGMWVLPAVVTLAAGLVLGVPHRLLWAAPPRNITAGIVTRVWEACGITRPAERAYVTAVVVTGGGWLSAAIAGRAAH
jgi:hypothetical protein